MTAADIRLECRLERLSIRALKCEQRRTSALDQAFLEGAWASDASTARGAHRPSAERSLCERVLLSCDCKPRRAALCPTVTWMRLEPMGQAHLRPKTNVAASALRSGRVEQDDHLLAEHIRCPAPQEGGGGRRRSLFAARLPCLRI